MAGYSLIFNIFAGHDLFTLSASDLLYRSDFGHNRILDLWPFGGQRSASKVGSEMNFSGAEGDNPLLDGFSTVAR